MARRHVYGYGKPRINSRYIDKGILCEQDGIDLYNEVFFKSLQKNKERRTNSYLSGEADLLDDSEVIDIKITWSLETFPETKRAARTDAEKAGYNWQLAAYMWLFDKPRARVAYCAVDTPPEFTLALTDPCEHNVSHLPATQRITTVEYERDSDIETQIALHCIAAKSYFNEVVDEIIRDHQI